MSDFRRGEIEMKNEADEIEKIKMGEYLELDDKKIQKIVNIKINFLNGKMSLEEAKKELRASVDKATAQEFAICEQYLQEYNISDIVLADRLEEILEIFDGLLVSEKTEQPLGHPIRTYLEEVKAIRKVLSEMQEMLKNQFIKNQWAEIYEKLSKINIHFKRKQNQLFPALERKGLDKRFILCR